MRAFILLSVVVLLLAGASVEGAQAVKWVGGTAGMASECGDRRLPSHCRPQGRCQAKGGRKSRRRQEGCLGEAYGCVMDPSAELL